MSQNQKAFTKVLRYVMSAIVGAIFAAVIVTNIQNETVGEIKPYPSKPAPIPADCWNGGEGHPYPSRVMYNDRMRGQKVVDSLVEEMFGNRPGPFNPDLVEYFCK